MVNYELACTHPNPDSYTPLLANDLNLGEYLIIIKSIVFFKAIAILITFTIATKVKSQTLEDLKFAKGLFSDRESLEKHYVSFDNPNEAQLIAISAFRVYKKNFSSQDGNHCIFYPSCSSYTIGSIKKHGLLIGLLYGTDRLQRCNRLNVNRYKKYKNTNLLYDPVE